MRLAGAWRLPALAPNLKEVRRRLADSAGQAGITWDLRDVDALDSAAAAVLWEAWGARRPQSLLARPEHEALFERLAGVPAAPRPGREGRLIDGVVRIGRKALHAADHVAGLIALIGQLVLDVAFLAINPRLIPWREWSANLYRTGALALPITAVVGFLIGIVISYLSARQLENSGANIFIVDLLGISILRELGPLLAAILVAGRSGSSMTAQIGLMRVTQELDALLVMDISHSQRLVLPKVLGLGLALPLLVLWTDVVALWGGMLAARRELGIGYALFLSRLPQVVPISNLWIGVSKGALFGLLIAMIACHYGLRIQPNAESLGSYTTRSVVTAITTVIVVDALFAVVFSRVGL